METVSCRNYHFKNVAKFMVGTLSVKVLFMYGEQRLTTAQLHTLSPLIKHATRI